MHLMEVKEVKGVCGPIQGRKVHHIPVASSFNFFNFINFINFRNLSYIIYYVEASRRSACFVS